MVTRHDIDALAGRIVAEFHPDRILLFGSHASDTATPDSDVDLLIVMPHPGKPWRQATEIRTRTRPPFPVDILVRSAAEVSQRLALGDSFFRDIVASGKVLHDATGK